MRGQRVVCSQSLLIDFQSPLGQRKGIGTLAVRPQNTGKINQSLGHQRMPWPNGFFPDCEAPLQQGNHLSVIPLVFIFVTTLAKVIRGEFAEQVFGNDVFFTSGTRAKAVRALNWKTRSEEHTS